MVVTCHNQYVRRGNRGVLLRIAGFHNILLWAIRSGLGIQIVRLRRPKAGSFVQGVTSYGANNLSLYASHFRSRLRGFIRVLPVDFVLLARMFVPSVLLGRFPVALCLYR